MIPFISDRLNGKPNSKFLRIPHLPFIDYKKDIEYKKDTEIYWKPLDEVFEDYVSHSESKLDGDIGKLQRKHIVIDKSCIRYIGKESNELEEAEVVGVDEDDYIQYERNLNDKDLIEIIQ
jgi:hypothetical protein